MERLGSLNHIPQLFERCASAKDLVKSVEAYKFPPDVTEEEWLAATKIVGNAAAGDLGWLSALDQSWFHRCCVEFVRNALTKSWPGDHIQDAKLKDSLLHFTNWLERQSDEQVVDFAWKVIAADLRAEERTNYSPVLWMKRSGRLKEEISFDNLELAVSLAEESKAMYWWPAERWRVVLWARESQPYIDLMNYSSYLVRASAAGCLGQIFYGCMKNTYAEVPPPLHEVLGFIKEQERRHAGVAGPFLMGAQWGIDWTGDSEFDYRTWFLDVLRNSERERIDPYQQSLEFYAHEFFDRDAPAIEEFIQMGRVSLAVMTATNCPEAIYDLLPLLQKMAASNNPQMAHAMTTYLAEGRHHAGMQFVDD